MKEGWTYKKLGEICRTYSGGTPLKNVREYYLDGNIPWLRSGEVCKKYIFETEMFITQKGLENSSAKYYPIDTVVVAMYGATAAQVGILKIEATSNQAICGILPNSKFQPEFLYYFFSYRKEFLASQAQGGAQPNISQVKIKNLEVPVPPLSEQQSIVEYLDSAFAKIDAMKANAEKALNEAKALFQASLKEMLEPKDGWEEKALKDLGITQTGTTPSKSDKANYGDYIEFIRPSEIDYNGNGGIDYNCEMKLSEQGASKGRIFVSNSIFMVCIGATIGKVGFSTKDISCNQQINVFTPKEEINYKFAYYAMRSPSFQRRVIKEGTSSQATLPIINKGKWEQLSIAFPKIKEQELIASHLDSVSSIVLELKANYNKISQECDALKRAILRQVFE
ncbi:MAG: restriction endonuclease subunit S [Bacteroidales bacterium]|nr:restriction endonuclease subunit S [Bacteroidales bacterium]